MGMKRDIFDLPNAGVYAIITMYIFGRFGEVFLFAR